VILPIIGLLRGCDRKEKDETYRKSCPEHPLERSLKGARDFPNHEKHKNTGHNRDEVTQDLVHEMDALTF
jgi:hypothetical protein